MNLRYLSKGILAIFAGGDPWKVNATLQSGKPLQIGDLAQAFHDAGQSTQEADNTFAEARRRLQAWVQDNGQHPIPNSTEVQRTVAQLGLQAAQLPKIGTDLENIAAALAQAQETGNGYIADLEANLQALDDSIGWAREGITEDEQLLAQPHDREDEDNLQDDISEYEEEITGWEADAVHDTKATLQLLEQLRDDYSHVLQNAENTLRGDGYDPARVWALDGHLTETPGQAETDVRDALAGHQGAAARVNSVLGSITPDQLAGRMPLNPEQAAVLSQLQGQEHGMSLEALKDAEGKLGDQKGMIGDSWQLMSNANLSFPSGQGSAPQRGGAGLLPDSVQQVLNAPGYIYSDQTKTIADIAKDGNPAMQRNTRLDQGLLHRAAEMMDTGPMWDHNLFESQVSSVFAAAGRDHAAVNGLLNPQGAPDQSTKNFLKNLTHHTWKDGGTAAGSLFSWTEHPAAGEAQIAGQTAHAYADYLGRNAHDLLTLPGNHTLGQLNPQLVQAMAHGLGPYVNNVAGASGGLPGFGTSLDMPGSPGSEGLPLAKGVFSVLDTDKDAANYFNGQAYAQAVLHDIAFGNEATHSGYDPQLYDSATLRALVDVGTHNAFQANEDNGYHQGVSEYDAKKTAYETGMQAASTVGGFIPGAGKVAGPVIGMVGHSLENHFLGPAPTAPAENPIQGMDVGRADSEMLDAMLATGQSIPGLPQDYIVVDHDHPQGRIATLAEMQARHPGLVESQYNGVVGPALSAALGLPPGEKMSPDQYMTDRYDDVVGVPHSAPPK